MNNNISYCGLDCERCEARVATITNDQKLKEEIAKTWSQLNGTTITADMINCTGCKIDGPKTIFCESLCEIRKCAIKKELEMCSKCKELHTCKTILPIVQNNKDAKRNLKY